jgi:hypothetical protein
VNASVTVYNGVKFTKIKNKDRTNNNSKNNTKKVRRNKTHRVGNKVQLVELVDKGRLGLAVAVIGEPVLGGEELGVEGLVVLGADERGVLGSELVADFVAELLKGVASVGAVALLLVEAGHLELGLNQLVKRGSRDGAPLPRVHSERDGLVRLGLLGRRLDICECVGCRGEEDKSEYWRIDRERGRALRERKQANPEKKEKRRKKKRRKKTHLLLLVVLLVIGGGCSSGSLSDSGSRGSVGSNLTLLGLHGLGRVGGIASELL